MAGRAKERTVVVEPRITKGGKQVFDARWYCPDYTYCDAALRASRKYCRGHKKGTCGFDSEAEALAAGYAAQAAARNGGRGSVDASADLTLDDAAQDWFDSGPSGIKSPRTLRGYRERWRAWNNRKASIGLIPVSAVDKGRVTGWLQELRHSGLSASTMRQDLILLRHILNHAVALGVIDLNPASETKVPESLQEPPSKRPRLTESEMWDVANTLPDDYRLIVLLGTYTGLRLGELLGLRIRQIDRSVYPYVINVTGQWDERDKVFRLPKRGKTRPIPITPWISHFVDAQIAMHTGNEHGTLFATSKGTIIQQTNFRKVWNRALAELGLPHCSPHSMRATFVDIWIDRGMPISDVRDMAGHTDITVTMNTYKGDASTEKLSSAVMAAAIDQASRDGDTGQLLNAVNGIITVDHIDRHGIPHTITGLPTQPNTPATLHPISRT